jgi:hypothetical protein
MKKLTLFVAALCATTMAVNAATFVKTDLTSIKNTDVVLIVGTTSGGSYAMSNDKGASAAPTAVSVTVSGTSIETEATNILWNISYDAKTSTFTANVAGENDTLYCNNTNNGVRVGTKNANVLFNIKDAYIYNTTQKRYLGVYNNADWRCYTSIVNNIKDQAFAFYVKEVGPAVDATAVALDKNAVELAQYKYITLTATPTPADATDEWEWKSDNEEVATVNAKGKVTVLADNGTATITVTSKTTATVTATCVVTAIAADVLTCAQAVEIAKTVSANNEVAAGGKYVIRGYVTKIVETFGSYGNMSVMMADVAGDEGTFEAFRVIPIAEADQKIKVGDLVEVVGDITKYNTTYETVTGGSIRLITAGPATALENVEALEVYAENGRIYAAEGARIFTVSGIDVTEMNGQLNGIYIVKVGNQATKIAVK